MKTMQQRMTDRLEAITKAENGPDGDRVVGQRLWEIVDAGGPGSNIRHLQLLYGDRSIATIGWEFQAITFKWSIGGNYVKQGLKQGGDFTDPRPSRDRTWRFERNNEQMVFYGNYEEWPVIESFFATVRCIFECDPDALLAGA